MRPPYGLQRVGEDVGPVGELALQLLGQGLDPLQRVDPDEKLRRGRRQRARADKTPRRFRKGQLVGECR